MDRHRRIDQPLRGAKPIDVMFANNAHGSSIRDLAVKCGWGGGWVESLDWSDIEPFWLIAGFDGDMHAAVQVCVGKPVGRIELLCVNPDLGPRKKAMVVREICNFALEILKAGGSQAVTSTVGHDMRYFRNVLKRRGAIVVDSGSTLGMTI